MEINITYNKEHNILELDNGMEYMCLSREDAKKLINKIKIVLDENSDLNNLKRTSYYNGGCI